MADNQIEPVAETTVLSPVNKQYPLHGIEVPDLSKDASTALNKIYQYFRYGSELEIPFWSTGPRLKSFKYFELEPFHFFLTSTIKYNNLKLNPGELESIINVMTTLVEKIINGDITKES